MKGGAQSSNEGARHHWPPRWRRPWLWVILWFIKIELKQTYCSCSRNKKIH